MGKQVGHAPSTVHRIWQAFGSQPHRVDRSVADLERTITAYVEATNADPKPFRWTKTAKDILDSIPPPHPLPQKRRMKWI